MKVNAADFTIKKVPIGSSCLSAGQLLDLLPNYRNRIYTTDIIVLMFTLTSVCRKHDLITNLDNAVSLEMGSVDFI